MNELADIISNYYPDNIKAALELGATTFYYGPSSQKSIPENSEILFEKIRTTHQRVKQSVVLGVVGR